jgi:hypothetical protein
MPSSAYRLVSGILLKLRTLSVVDGALRVSGAHMPLWSLDGTRVRPRDGESDSNHRPHGVENEIGHRRMAPRREKLQQLRQRRGARSHERNGSWRPAESDADKSQRNEDEKVENLRTGRSVQKRNQLDVLEGWPQAETSPGARNEGPPEGPEQQRQSHAISVANGGCTRFARRRPEA